MGLQGKSGLAGFLLSRIASDEAEILTIVVEFAWRRLGCAQKMVENHCSQLIGRGVTTLFLEVNSENAAARALYRRNGFVEAGLRKAYYAKADGCRGDAVVMRRDFA